MQKGYLTPFKPTFSKMKNLIITLFIFSLFFLGCKSYVAQPYDFPNPVDTTTKPIEYQEKKVYEIAEEGVFADNLFDGARLNNFEYKGDNRYLATISPENIPINHSPYYAFRIWSNESKSIELELNYSYSRHRYPPKLSVDGENWILLDSNLVVLSEDTVNAILTLNISSDTLWVAGQEVQNSAHNEKWCKEKSTHPDVQLSSIGKSKLGRDIWFLDINQGDTKDKDVIVILSRQHPPEVTGYFAMQAFIDEILADNVLSNAFRKKYRLLVIPLMNPDGVDLGHWRHNVGGVDLNRDWAYYHQPENRQVADFIVKSVKENKSDVILGLDFHSTWWDVYYTNREIPKFIPHFKEYWFHGINQSLGEEINEKPSNLGGPNSKNWMFTQFGALGITYEIGDNTPREFIKVKGRVTATEMMQLLIFQDD